MGKPSSRTTSTAACVTAVSGGAIPAEWAIGGMTVMFVVYGVAGGLSAAVVTDFVQGLSCKCGGPA